MSATLAPSPAAPAARDQPRSACTDHYQIVAPGGRLDSPSRLDAHATRAAGYVDRMVVVESDRSSEGFQLFWSGAVLRLNRSKLFHDHAHYKWKDAKQYKCRGYLL